MRHLEATTRLVSSKICHGVCYVLWSFPMTSMYTGMISGASRDDAMERDSIRISHLGFPRDTEIYGKKRAKVGMRGHNKTPWNIRFVLGESWGWLIVLAWKTLRRLWIARKYRSFGRRIFFLLVLKKTQDGGDRPTRKNLVMKISEVRETVKHHQTATRYTARSRNRTDRQTVHCHPKNSLSPYWISR